MPSDSQMSEDIGLTSDDENISLISSQGSGMQSLIFQRLKFTNFRFNPTLQKNLSNVPHILHSLVAQLAA